jgi:hypothetical protein
MPIVAGKANTYFYLQVPVELQPSMTKGGRISAISKVHETVLTLTYLRELQPTRFCDHVTKRPP